LLHEARALDVHVQRRSQGVEGYTGSMATEAEIIESVTTAIEGCLALPILERHKRDIISGLLWKITEARGKYKTRYRSRAAMEKGAKVQHEHVFTRKDLTNRILAEPERAREILKSAIACVVTIEEHKRLSKVAESICGWDRYAEVGIEVIDLDGANLPPADSSPGG
jgi:hypothetical protein